VTARANDGQEELARAGTGELAQQLKLFGGFTAMIENQRAWECESRVQAMGPHQGERLQKALPPYVKWPLFKARPQRNREVAPSFGMLCDDHCESAKEVSQVVKVQKFNLLTVPRLVAEVTYLAGELGVSARRMLCALAEYAVKNGPSGEDGYRLSVRILCDLLGISTRSRSNYEEIPAVLWGLSRTVVHLNSRDELSKTWGTDGFLLLPRVAAVKDGREWMIEYDFPPAAKKMINQGQLCTVDTHRLKALRSPSAETLYCLLYDVAQWSKLPSVVYTAPDLRQRLGLSMPTTKGRSADYAHWGRLVSQIRDASERVYGVGQCLSDYRIFGKGAEAAAEFYFVSGNCRKGHLPPGSGPEESTPVF